MKHSSARSKAVTWKTSVHSKSLLLAIAALALTATNAQAYSGEMLEKAGLTGEQREAFKEAHDLRLAGEKDKARDVLVQAGIDTSVIEKVRNVMSRGSTHLHTKSPHRFVPKTSFPELTPSEQAAFAVAKAANDRDAMDAILEEAGIQQSKTHRQKFLRDGRELSS